MSKTRVPQVAKLTSIDGELGRFQVESLTNTSEAYMVDLLANGGRGECSCTDWLINCRANLKKFEDDKLREYGQPGKPNPDRQQCKHIYIAKRQFVNDMLYHLSKQQTS